MNEAQIPPSHSSASPTEVALVGYQIAVALWTYQGEQGWARFNTMLVANTLIMAVAGVAIASERDLPILTIALPAAGIILCATWYIFGKREADYSDYYIMSARELEEKYLSGVIRTVSRGGHFAEGSHISIEVDGRSVPRRMSKLGQVLRAKTAINVITAILVALYVALLLQSLFR